jgi:hypothetical protein
MTDQYIKSGRNTFILKDGDTVMDNGKCLQLTSRRIMKGFNSTVPRISKSEFNRFKSYSNVSQNKNHHYSVDVTLWTIKI